MSTNRPYFFAKAVLRLVSLLVFALTAITPATAATSPQKNFDLPADAAEDRPDGVRFKHL